jgi:hypothetical protein
MDRSICNERSRKYHNQAKNKILFVSPPTIDPVKNTTKKSLAVAVPNIFLLVFGETLAMPVCRNALSHGIFALKRPYDSES